jgi:hypothetical protein
VAVAVDLLPEGVRQVDSELSNLLGRGYLAVATRERSPGRIGGGPSGCSPPPPRSVAWSASPTRSITAPTSNHQRLFNFLPVAPSFPSL